MNKKGKRSSSAYAFIESQLKNPLLNLLLETTVKEIIIENEDKWCYQYKIYQPL